MSDRRNFLKYLGYSTVGFFGSSGYFLFGRVNPTVVDSAERDWGQTILVRVGNSGRSGDVRVRVLFYNEQEVVVDDYSEVAYVERMKTRDVSVDVSPPSNAEYYRAEAESVGLI